MYFLSLSLAARGVQSPSSIWESAGATGSAAGWFWRRAARCATRERSGVIKLIFPFSSSSLRRWAWLAAATANEIFSFSSPSLEWSVSYFQSKRNERIYRVMNEGENSRASVRNSRRPSSVRCWSAFRARNQWTTNHEESSRSSPGPPDRRSTFSEWSTSLLETRCPTRATETDIRPLGSSSSSRHWSRRRASRRTADNRTEECTWSLPSTKRHRPTKFVQRFSLHENETNLLYRIYHWKEFPVRRNTACN